MTKKYMLYSGVGHIADNHNLETGKIIGTRLEITGNVGGCEITMMLLDLSGRLSDIGCGLVSEEERAEIARIAAGAKISVWIEVG